ncbi:hypothetical protein ACFVTJ_04075 [Agrobacterium sp. NPDC058088]|uniref:hypothetical protein n=1 Tax=Agrobacterium sp. NPDC058088 TaxID=3346335 RepID=UPI0036D96982
MNWKITLDDGSQHDVEMQITYKVGNGKEMKEGVLLGDPEALTAAITDSAVTLDGPTGVRIPVHVELVNGQWKMYPRTL